jgi:hypothetical protein
MNISRILPVVGAVAASLAAEELTTCRPFIDKALDELPADLKSGDPATAVLTTCKNAGEAMLAAGFTNISLTGLLGSAWHAFTGAGAAPSTVSTMGAPPPSDPPPAAA